MNELKVNLENLTEEERKLLAALLEKSQTPKISGTWFPKLEEGYWVLTDLGELRYTFGNDSTDSKIFELQDPCKTKEEAQQKLEQQKALVQVNRQVRDIIAKEYPNWMCNWKLHYYKYYPSYYHENSKVEIKYSQNCQYQFLFEHAPANVWERIDENLIKKAMGI